KLIRAPKERVWSLLEDVEGWPNWAPANASNRVISHPILSKEGNVVTCDEYEQAGILITRHTDRYALYPQERIEEEIIEGDFVGGIVLTLEVKSEGTLVHVDADVSPRNPWVRSLADISGADKILLQFWIDLFDQLA